MAGGGVVVQGVLTWVASRAGRLWTFILDIALTLWVVRVPLVSLALGFLILGFAPQAADALVDVAIGDQLADWWDMPPSVRLLILIFLLWAMPVHYSARLLLETDQRYRATALTRGVGPRPDPPATSCGICALLRECFTCGPPFGCVRDLCAAPARRRHLPRLRARRAGRREVPADARKRGAARGRRRPAALDRGAHAHGRHRLPVLCRPAPAHRRPALLRRRRPLHRAQSRQGVPPPRHGGGPGGEPRAGHRPPLSAAGGTGGRRVRVCSARTCWRRTACFRAPWRCR